MSCVSVCRGKGVSLAEDYTVPSVRWTSPANSQERNLGENWLSMLCIP